MSFSSQFTPALYFKYTSCYNEVLHQNNNRLSAAASSEANGTKGYLNQRACRLSTTVAHNVFFGLSTLHSVARFTGKACIDEVP